MKKFTIKMLLAGTALSVIATLTLQTQPPAHAQTPALPPQPYNTELGAVITNGARAPSTVTTAKLTNLAYNGVECTFNQTAVSGSSSTTFGIQMYDSASNTYQTLLTSAATTTAINTPSTITIYPGITAAANVSLSAHLPLYWRVTQTNAGANTTTTGTIGCNLLK